MIVSSFEAVNVSFVGAYIETFVCYGEAVGGAVYFYIPDVFACFGGVCDDFVGSADEGRVARFDECVWVLTGNAPCMAIPA